MNSETFCLPQSKPLIPLQKEEDPETHKTVLTNYMFPQQTRTEDCKYLSLSKTAFIFLLSCVVDLSVSQIKFFKRG